MFKEVIARVARGWWLVLCVGIAILTGAATLRAQTTDATLSGTIMDPQGKVVPGVDVNVTNVDTNVTYDTKTNGDGIYVVPDLPPGRYRLAVMKEGFKSVTLTDIVLHVQDTVSHNFNLELGAASETVNVVADQNNIDTTDATVSTTIDRNFAENLPLDGRSFQTLILLAAGTVLSITNNTANGGTFSVNGQRANANSFTVDGVSANGGGYLNQSNLGSFNGANPNFSVAGTTQGMVSVDALQEFKIQTSTYAPEFGSQPGGQVSLLTRSGTNAFHGTVFDYFRNTVLDANNWFNDEQGEPKAVDQQNDFGGTLGGAIFKDRTFFFFSYEGLRLNLPTTENLTVPSLCLRGLQACATGSPAAVVFQPILNSWPLPNPSGNGRTYTLSESLPTNLDSYMIRIDHSLGKRVHLFGTYADNTSSTTAVNGGNMIELEGLTGRVLTVGADVSLGPGLENELRLNYGVNVSNISKALNFVGGAKPYDTALIYPAPLTASTDDDAFQVFVAPFFLSTSPGPVGKFSQRQINLVDNVAHSTGSHQLKWGIDYRRLFPIYAQAPAQAALKVTSMADLIAGNISTAFVESLLVAHPIYTNLSLYGQDTWRASNRLTLTYGLRWELNPPPGERDGIQPLNVIGLNNPATATLAPLNSKLYKTTYDNFAPRIGLAYQLRQSPSHETVVRGGLGIFYDLDSETAALGFGSPPFSNDSAFHAIPFPIADDMLVVPPVPAPLTPPYSQLYATDPNLALPYTLQWNVSVEQALGQNQSLTAFYVAAAGYRLLRSDELYDINPEFDSIDVVRNVSSSNYQSLQVQFNRRLTHGLQALASYTYAHSIDNASDAQVTYSTSPSGNAFLNPNIDRGNSDFDMRHAFRGAFTYSIPAWGANFFSKALLGGWSADAVGIAQTGLPVNLVGASYFPNDIPDGSLTLRPNVVLGEPLYLYGANCASVMQGLGELGPGQPCPGGRAFDPNAFSPVPTDPTTGDPTQLQGTLRRNVMRGPGAWQVDFALHRTFSLTEHVNLQFRSEFFNIFNHPNFGPPDSGVGDGQFGLATNTLNKNFGSGIGLNSLYAIGGPRSIQFALKLLF